MKNLFATGIRTRPYEARLRGLSFCLIEKNVEIAYSHQEIEAILVEAEISELLNVPVGQPLLQVHSITYALDATPILYDVSLYRADRYTFKNTDPL